MRGKVEPAVKFPSEGGEGDVEPGEYRITCVDSRFRAFSEEKGKERLQNETR